MTECLKNYEWRFITLQEVVIKTIPKKKEMQGGKVVGLHIAEKRSEAKSKGERERYTHLNAEFQR